MKSRRFKELAILGVVLATIAVAALHKSPTSYPPVTLKMTQATTGELLWKVAELEHLTVVGAAPVKTDAKGHRQDYDFMDAPLESVVGESSSSMECKLLGDVLVAVTRSELYRGCLIRMELVLDEAPAAKLVPVLKRAIPGLRITLHPTMNGLFATGSKDDLLELKGVLEEVDRNPVPPMPVRYRRRQVQWLDAEELKRSVKSRFPEISTRIEGDNLVVSGRLPVVEEALQYAAELDRKTVRIPVSLKQLKQSSPTCRFDTPYGENTSTVDCPESCHGPLQVLGLQNGDILPDYYNDPLRAKPEWWVQRDGKDYRIVLEVAR